MSWKLRSKVLVDIGMMITMLASLVTGVVVWLVLPHGKGAGRSVFLGLTRLTWSDVHTYSSFVFALMLIVHLALNWRLFWSMARCFSHGKRGAQG